MRKLLPAVVAILLLFVLVDIGAKAFEQSQLASASKARSVNVGSVKVSFDGLPNGVSGFPYTLDVLADGKVSKATIEMRDVTVSPLSMKLVKVRVDDLDLGRSAAAGSARKVSGIGSARVTVVLSPRNIGDLLNTNVQLRSGYFNAVVDGTLIDGKVSVSGRQVVVDDGEHPPVKFDMPGKQYLPCTPKGVNVSASGMSLSCTTSTLPSAVAEILS